MMTMVYYNIHNIIGVDSNIEVLPKYFKSKLKGRKRVDLVIRKGEFRFDKRKYERMGLKFYGGEGNLYLEYKIYGKPIQRLLIKNLTGKTEFYYTSVTDRIFDVTGIINMLLEIKLLQKGYAMIHSAGVSKDGKGYLFSGWSETGKSSTVFGLAKRKDIKMLGDDFVILSKGGKVFSYPEKAGIFFFSKNVENLNLSPMQRIELAIKYAIAKLPPLYLYISPNLRVDLTDLADVGDSARLDKTYFIAWGEGKEKMRKSAAIGKLIASTLHSVFGNLFSQEAFLAYCYLNGFDADFIEKKLREILGSALGKCTLIKSKKKQFHKYLDGVI